MENGLNYRVTTISYVQHPKQKNSNNNTRILELSRYPDP